MSEQKKETKPVDSYDYLKASSAQDCTGLIPSGIQNEEELEKSIQRRSIISDTPS